jgi:TRAP transporter TAXI family solute receptor
MAALAIALPLASYAQDTLRFVTVGSAGLTGSYYAAAHAICDAVNRSHSGQIRCSPEPTKGSLYNLRSILRGDQDFAFVQSDWQKMAVEGRGPFAKTGPITELRSVMALYPESVTLVARKDANIRGIEDLPGKRLDVGAVATARRATALKLLSAAGYAREDFSEWHELTGSSTASELCSGRVDASLQVFGHPNAAMASLLESCALEIVPLKGPAIDEFLDLNPDYSPTFIPIGSYPQLAFDIETVALSATLVTRADIPAPLVWTFTTEILLNLDILEIEAPVIDAPDLNWMQTEGLSAPMHPGAVAAFQAVEGS